MLLVGASLIGFAVWRRRRRRALPDLPVLKDMAVVRQLQGSGAFLSTWTVFFYPYVLRDLDKEGVLTPFLLLCLCVVLFRGDDFFVWWVDEMCALRR